MNLYELKVLYKFNMRLHYFMLLNWIFVMITYPLWLISIHLLLVVMSWLIITTTTIYLLNKEFNLYPNMSKPWTHDE